MLSEGEPYPYPGPVTGRDPEKIRKIREQILVVFGRTSPLCDAELERRYDLTGKGELVMIR
ncbi:MAG TPA: hypothetical protein VMT44_00745 [Methanoregula sp.]|nr:hypothetical protein [Methanoregula sp.]